MKNLIPKLGCALVACGLVATPVWAQSIGVNFVGRDTAQSTLQPSQTAGIVPQANWNNIAGEPFSGGPYPMATDSGEVVAVTLTWQANDSWRHDGALPATPTGDDILMKGIHKANPNPDTDEASSFMRFTFGGLLAGSTYDVIAYMAHNGANAEADMTVGNTTYYVTQQSPYTPPWVQGTATTSAGRSEANYVRWNNVTPAADGTLLVQAKKNIVTPQVTDGIGVSGLQLIRLTGEWPGTPAPGITGQPADVLTVAGTAVNFTVGVTGPWAVQWQKNGVDIPGATSPTYSLTAAVADNGATYAAVVTNPVGTVTSREALLEVDAPAPEQMTRGFLKVEHYGGIGGTAVIPFYSDPRYTTRSYDYATFAFGANVLQTAPDASDFARIVSGWVQPPTTGQWRFFTRSDDASEVHFDVGVTHPAAITDPHNRLPVAEETGCCAAFQAPGDPRTSQPFALTAGTRYAFLAVYKEGGGGDWLQVAWREESDTTAPASLAPISPLSVWTMASPAGQRAEITQQPTPQTAQAGRFATFTANMATRPTPNLFGVQWTRNGVDIPGANALTYRTPVLAMADNGAVFAAKFYTMRGEVVSSNATLTVVPDTFPPVPSVGAIVNRIGPTVDVGVGFDEVVTDATASVQANYTVSGGTVTGFSYYPKSQSALLKVTGIAPGASGTVTVRNVADVSGNAIPAAGVSMPFTVPADLRWNIVGAPDQQDLGTVTPVPLDGNYVVPVGEDAFDIFSNGRGQWNNYDESVFVYEEITGDFDKKLRVEFQENSSQWARAGLIMREDTNFGDNLDAQAGTQVYGNAGVAPFDGIATRYQKVHVNPVGPTLTGPGNNGNGQWEGNRRLETGGPSSSVGGGGIPLYPDAWCRIQRVGGAFTIYRSDNGTTWTSMGTTTFDPPMPATVYVGPDYSPEVGNITNLPDRGTFVAKMRDYGDTFAAGAPALASEVLANGDIRVTFEGTLQQRAASGGDWTPAGVTSPATITPSGTGTLYRAVQ